LNFKTKYFSGFFVVTVCLLVISGGCSTTKNTFTRRVYHNLTSHYNVYFNGKEALKEAVADIELNHEDNYMLILPVYKLSTKEKVQGVYPQLDKAIAKSTKTIQLHSIYIKGVEHIKWIDDAWLLMGKANYYKKDYAAALRIFDFIRTRFSKNLIRYDAMLWMARCDNQIKNYIGAQALLDQIKNHSEKDKTTKELDKSLPLVYAESYISQASYKKAIPYLEAALALGQTKKTKLRIYYILGQIFQEENNNRRAAGFYKLALKGNNSFIMSFNAKLKMAECFDISQGNSEEITDLLKKMIKDDKNKEHLDQIYFALAQIDMKMKNEPGALSNLKLSVKKSVSNNYQKAVSSLKLADIYFAKPDFINARMYYDTAMSVMPKDFPDYDQIKDRTNILDNLVKNLLIIQTEDSLQHLASLPDAERNRIIDKVIEEYRKIEEQKKKEEQIKLENQNILTQNNVGNNLNRMVSPTQNAWYFYNPTTMQFGVNEFVRKWGNRKLEDNWILSNKQESGFGADNPDNNEVKNETENPQKKDAGNPLDRNFYLKGLPLTKDLLEKSDKLIQQAMYNAGIQYSEGLNDDDRAIEILEKLLSRYPDCPQKVNACYQLYKLYTDKNLTSKADIYKGIIISQFPESDYARLLTDPEYYKKMQIKSDREKVFYSQTYDLFLNKNFSTVIVNCDSALTKSRSNKDLAPKFEYLKAISRGKLMGNDTLETDINKFLKKYPGHELVSQAKIILEFLKKDNKKNVPDQNLPPVNGLYKISDAASHMYVLFVDDKNGLVNNLKNAISDFDNKYYSMEKLPVNSIMGFRGSQQIITISNIGNKEKAMLYFVSLQKDDKFKTLLQGAGYEHFIISVDNYSTLYKTKDLNAYKEFFTKNYPK